jgi:UDP-N-acetylmuramoyl-tripeptide--D-alanyl-D-alanine ligase
LLIQKTAFMETLKEVYHLLSEGYKICTDSRSVDNLSVFIALKGEKFDGNRFAIDAINIGAKLCIVDDQKIESNPKIRIVPNSLVFLQELASYHRDRIAIPIIGLTGSNGKTTTKELIANVLRKRFNTFATSGNLNNHIGVPLSILSIGKEHEIGIIEMGANHIGEIEHLCSISKPTHGLITNIGKAHLEGFGSLEGVKKAKTELYKFIEQNEGVAFINNDNKMLNELATKYNFKNIINYGSNSIHVESIESSSTFLKLKIELNNSSYIIDTKLVGEYNIENIRAALCIGNYFGVNFLDCLNAIAEYIPSNSRSQILKTDKNTIVLDAYNANPSSMEEALRNFSNIPSDKPKAVILGEMLELGEFSNEEHTNIADLSKKLFQNTILIGESFKHTKGNLRWFANAKECATHLTLNPLENYLILLKGSRGVRLETLLDLL